MTAATLRLTPPPPDPLVPVSATRLMADHHELRPVIIDGLIRETESANLIAASKVGKTYLALDLAVSVVTGRPWLGRTTSQGSVLYIDAELHPPTLSKRLESVAKARGVPAASLANIETLSMRGRLQDIFQLAAFFASIPKGRYRVIILDALYRLIPAGIDENSNADMTRVFNAIDLYGEQTGAAFVIVHHASKGNQSSKSVTDTGSGAGAIARAADSHIILRPHEDAEAVVMESVTRSFPPTPPVCLRWTYPTWSPDAALDPSALRRETRRKPKQAQAKGDDWTPASFVAAFITETPTDAKLIKARAIDALIPTRRADTLLRLSIDHGAYLWKSLGRAGDRYATVPPK